MTESIQLDTHYDCTLSHHITQLNGPDHLASLMPGTIILVNGWEYMRLAGYWPGWADISGAILSHKGMWERIITGKRDGWKVSLLHVGAA